MLYKGGTIGANGKEYRFEIITNNDTTAEKELTLVAHGLIVRVDGGELFAPLRGGSASITVLTDEIYPDIYASGAMDVPVTIYEDDSLFFAGYVTPCMYSQELPSHKIQLTIECVDCISVLQNVPYSGELSAISIKQYFVDAIAEVTHKLQLEIVEPFTQSIEQMYIQSANWFDEEDTPSKWSSVLGAICQWLGVQLTQWGNKWVLSPIHAISTPFEIDDIKCNLGAQVSLTEVHNKAKLTVSLYNGSTVIDNIFDMAELKNTGEFSGVDLKGQPGKYYSYLGFYNHPQIQRYDYAVPNVPTLAVTDDVNSISTRRGAWLVSQYSQGLVGAKKDGADAIENYLVLVNPSVITSDRDMVFPATDKTVMATISDTHARVFERNHVVTINGEVLLSNIPAPLLCPEFDGGKYDPATGKYKEDEKMTAPANIKLRVSCGAYQLGVDGGTMGWFHDKSSSTYRDWIAMPLWVKSNEENVWNKLISIPGESYKYHGEFGGFIIPMADGIEGTLKIDIIGFEAMDSIVDSVWIKDLSIDVRRQFYGGAREWFDREVNADEDIMYETETTANTVSEMKELSLTVSTDVGAEYSRSMVYQDASDLYPPYNFKKPLGELTSNITGEKAIAEHHLLNEMVRQYSTPRMIIQGTWREHVGNPLQPYISTSMRKTFLCEAIEVDCHGSTSTMTLEEVL